jgi:hypothetical protein
MENNTFIIIITPLLGVIGYLLKRILDKIDRMESNLYRIESDVADMKPKVQIMWEIMVSLVKGNHLSEALREKLK